MTLQHPFLRRAQSYTQSESTSRCPEFTHDIYLSNSRTTDSLFLLASQQDCIICFGKTVATDIRSCPSCRTRCCHDCLATYLRIKVTSGQVLPKQMVCPGPQCTHRLDRLIFRAHLEHDMYKKYLTFLELHQPGIRFCPARDCGAIISEAKFSTHRKVVCHQCLRESCIRCGESYHRLRTCRRAYRKWRVAKDVRPCPKCHWEIEKDGGCEHMSCTRCGFEFCWICMQDWLEHNDWMCVPLSLYHSQKWYFGQTKPFRFLTKSLMAGTVLGGVVVAAGVAAVVIPTIYVGGKIKEKVKPHDPRGVEP